MDFPRRAMRCCNTTLVDTLGQRCERILFNSFHCSHNPVTESLMLNWDEEIRLSLQSQTHRGDTTGRLMQPLRPSNLALVLQGESVPPAAPIAGFDKQRRSFRQCPVAYCGTQIAHMTSRIPQTVRRAKERADGACSRVHGAGIEPNIMNRFMPSDVHEVLFVN